MNSPIPSLESILRRSIDWSSTFLRTSAWREGARQSVARQYPDELHRYLNENGIEAKIHYPIPVHLQEAARHLGYKDGDFPVSEADSRSILTLPAHQHLSKDEIGYTIEKVREFYLKKN